MSREYRITGETRENGYPEYEVVLDDKLCPRCRSGRIHVHSAGVEREFNDIDEDGNFRKVKVRFPRYRCRDCGKTWSPLPQNLVFSYTPEFKDHLINRYFNSGESIRELAEHYHIKEQNIRKFIREYISGWNGKRAYRMPEQAGLFLVDTPAGRLYALVDVGVSSLLDLAEEETVLNMDWDKADSVYLAGFDIPEKILDNIGREKLVFPDAFRFEDGLDALEADARDRGIGIENLREILVNADTEIPYEQIIKYPALMPVVIAAKNLKQHENKKEMLLEPDSDLKNYLAYCMSLERSSGPSDSEMEKETSDYFDRLVKKFREKEGKIDRKFNSADKVRGKLLFGDDAQPAVTDPESGELLVSFGKRI